MVSYASYTCGEKPALLEFEMVPRISEAHPRPGRTFSVRRTRPGALEKGPLNCNFLLERATGLEPATVTLAS
jgi:hypothetical protein